MNKARAKKLENIMDQLEALIEEEVEAYDNIPATLAKQSNAIFTGMNITNLNRAKDVIDEVLLYTDF